MAEKTAKENQEKSLWCANLILSTLEQSKNEQAKGGFLAIPNVSPKTLPDGTPNTAIGTYFLLPINFVPNK